jgi:uncharacterized protein YndB with AHSA1/START domain
MNGNLLFDFAINKESNTVNIKREYKAGRELVWEAWTNPEILDQWWAPKPFESRTKVMDFKVGGRRFYASVSAEGQELNYSIQTYTAISPKTNFKFTSLFADKDENTFPPGSDWDLTFSEENGISKVSISIYNESLERMEKMIEMGFKEGFTATLNKLENLL